VRLQLHDAARHAGIRAESDDASDVQLRGAGRDSRREGRLERVLVANDVGRAINPRPCAEQMEGGVHMGLGYALSRTTSTDGRPDSLALCDVGIVREAHPRSISSWSKCRTKSRLRREGRR
jgi:hypothetical protein